MTPYGGNLQNTNMELRLLHLLTRGKYSLVVSVTFYDKLRPGCYRLSVTIEISQRHVKDNDQEPKSVLQRTGILSADTP